MDDGSRPAGGGTGGAIAIRPSAGCGARSRPVWTVLRLRAARRGVRALRCPARSRMLPKRWARRAERGRPVHSAPARPSRSTATRSSRPAVAACSSPTAEPWSDQARHLATQARDPAATLRAFRDRLQLPDEQSAGRNRTWAVDHAWRQSPTPPQDSQQVSRHARQRFRDSISCPKRRYGRSNAWLTCITVDSLALRRHQRRDPSAPGIVRHRGAHRLEADASPAGVPPLPHSRRRASRRTSSTRAFASRAAPACPRQTNGV